MSFSTLGLSKPLLRALAEKGYSTATPIQLKAIPPILAGKDVMAAAQTGTGKTGAFMVPLLQRLTHGSPVQSNHVRVLVLTPTRELAEQVARSVASYSAHLSLKSAPIYGGVKINPQLMKLRGGVDVLVATPGRLLDIFQKNGVKFYQVEALVLDEADRMLDLGFIDDIRKIIALLPKKRQNLLFSATFSPDIRTLGRKLLTKPLEIELSPPNRAAKSVKQWIYEVDKAKKGALLSHLIRTNDWQQILVFTRTKNGADQLVGRLNGDSLSAAAIHGDKSQGQRSRALADFKENKIRVLVATDIAARGIDISELPRVINFDLPKVAENYVHRIGRTGRAGLTGEGISLVSADEVPLLMGIETLIQQLLVREVVTGFVPKHSVPLTTLQKPRVKKPKKPKKKAPRADAPKSDEPQKGGRRKPRKRGGLQAGNTPQGSRSGRGKNNRRGAGVPKKRRGRGK